MAALSIIIKSINKVPANCCQFIIRSLECHQEGFSGWVCSKVQSRPFRGFSLGMRAWKILFFLDELRVDDIEKRFFNCVC